MKNFISILFILTTFLPARSSDSLNASQDTLVLCQTAFNKYLDHNTFAEYYPIAMLQEIFVYRQKFEADTVHASSILSESDAAAYMSADRAQTQWGPFVWTDTKLIGHEYGPSPAGFRKYDDIQFPDSIKRLFMGYFRLFKQAYPKKKVLAQKLTQALQKFQEEAVRYPTFYATIAHDYNGDIKAYVDDMFNSSILLDGTKHQRFLRKPSSFKMANDLGVQFVIGIAMYRLWMKEQAEK